MYQTASLHPTFGPLVALLASVATLLAVPGSPIAAQARAQAVALPALSPELEKARAALDKYRDPVLAVHDGYLSTLGCIEFPEGGREGTMQYAPSTCSSSAPLWILPSRRC